MFENVKPDLCILDGFIGMEGDGPILGNEVKLNIAMCSEDGVAVDSLASKIMGFDNIPYLKICQEKGIGVENVDGIQILNYGFENFKDLIQKVKPHYLFKYQTMSELNTVVPRIDFKFLIDTMKRSYRIKDKILEKIKARF